MLPVRFSANSQESLYLPQRGLQLQRGTELGNGIGGGALEEQQHSEVAEGVDVPGIESDDGFKLGRGQIRPSPSGIRQPDACGSGLGEALQ